jgi:dephospho-CoA kinase
MRVLITGMSGTGKTILVGELRRRGHEAYDADEDGFTEPGPDGRWSWRTDLIGALLNKRLDPPIFFAGCSEEQGQLPFDYTVLLSAPTQVLIDRIRTRTTNPFGQDERELRLILADVRHVEPLLRAAADLEIDSTAPVDEIAERILSHVL